MLITSDNGAFVRVGRSKTLLEEFEVTVKVVEDFFFAWVGMVGINHVIGP